MRYKIYFKDKSWVSYTICDTEKEAIFLAQWKNFYFVTFLYET